jgi:cytoskeletal protein RodZ
MSKKGRRARQKRRGSVAPSQEAMEQVTSLEADASPSAPPPPPETVEAVPPAAASPEPQTSAPSDRPPQPETPLSFSAQEPLPLPAPEDSSFPPVDLDSHFFDPKPDADDHHERDPRMVLKLGPEAARRRAQFQKYVKIAIAAASVLCLAALVKAAVARNHDEPMTHRTSAAVVAPPPAPVPTEQAVAPTMEQPAVAEPQATAPAATETAAAAPTQAPEQAAPTAAPPTAEAASATAEVAPTPADTAEAPAPDPKEAAKAKRASQAALERGKIADAIESGERSVALDPTDAEAWLILGAAYQSKGDQKNARRSFKSCLDQSKRGPKWECAQMPH